MAKHLSIRNARPDERRILEELQRRASLVYEDTRDALLAHPEAIVLPPEQIEAGYAFVAEREGTLLGFAVVLPRDDGERELDGLFVEPSLWRGGIGRVLVEEAARRTAAEGAKALCVVANPNALAFYEACGFVAIGESRTQFGVGITMRKDVLAS